MARDLGAQSIDLYGALGGRIDHEIANIHLLYYIIKRGLNPRILDKNRDLYIVGKDPLEISGKAGDLISLIPLYGDAKELHLVDWSIHWKNMIWNFQNQEEFQM